MSITLRAITEDDLADIMRWRMDPEITRYMNTNPKLTMEGQLKWLASIRCNPDVLYRIIEVDGEPAGVINLTGLTKEDGDLGWGYYVGEKRLRSLKTALSLEMSMYDYAFLTLGKRAVYSDVFTLNKGVITLHKLCGCEVVEELPAHVLKEGVYYDLTMVRMTAENWVKIRGEKKYEKIAFDEAALFIKKGNTMNSKIVIGNHIISEDSPTFVIAEMSANHLMDFDRAVAIMQAAKDAGADAIKVQTYTPDTITLDCDDECFQITQGTIWDGTTLHKLYQTAYTPWEWQPKLKKIAEEMGLVFFSSPFDLTSIDFLEDMDVPCYKVASFEINDIPFIRKIARTGKPIIMSTGIAYMEDIERALATCREEGNENVILLKCTSAYPAPYEDINLKTIPSMKEVFKCVVGLSDHTMGSAVAGAGVALGAKVVEKHLTLRRADGGADAAFSMEPEEFKEMVDNIRLIEKAVGKVTYDLTYKQKKSREHSRSLFVAKDMKAGDVFTPENLRSVRPSCGLHTMYYEELLGKKIRKDAKLGTPMSWDLVDFDAE